ncbi:unnamed protein product [Urochloa humidicola]
MSWPPERAGGGGATVMALLDLDGGDELISVAALKEGVPSLDIWDLRDHEAEIWALRCRVEVTVPRLYDGISKHRILSVGGGAILIGDSSCCTAYDLEGKRMLGEISFSREVPTFLMFRESLVPHAFFHSPPRSSQVAYIKFPD